MISKKLKPVTEIPLCNSSIKDMITNDKTVTIALHQYKTYIGTEYYMIKDRLAPKALRDKIHSMLGDEYNKKRHMFDYIPIQFLRAEKKGYKCSDKWCEYEITENGRYLILKSKNYEIMVNYKTYSYFKKLGVEFRFDEPLENLGMFLGNEFVGLVMPTRIQKAPETPKPFILPEDDKGDVFNDWDWKPIDDDDIPF